MDVPSPHAVGKAIPGNNCEALLCSEIIQSSIEVTEQ